MKTSMLLMMLMVCMSCNAQSSESERFEKIVLNPGERLMTIKEGGTIYLRVHGGIANPPTYECVCKAKDECSLRWIGPSEISGCGFVIVQSLPASVEAGFRARAFVLSEFPEQTAFNADGYRFISPWHIELKEEPATIYTDETGATVYELKAGPKIRCSCDCEVGGCGVSGISTGLFCSGDCQMPVDGNPCRGCGFELVPDK